MSGTPKQDRFMRAVAHGFTPDRVKAPPIAVAKEWTEEASGSPGRFGAIKAALRRRPKKEHQHGS